jgi:SAM-dependent methyltransferase
MSGPDAPRDDRAHWDERYAERGDETNRAPSSWVVERSLALPATALVLDIAAGSGRHAVPLAANGRTVIVLDFIERAVAAAVGRHPGVRGVVADVGAVPLRAESVDAVICVSFLDRSAFKAIIDLLRPGGALLYETFTRAHLDVVARGAARGPKNPEYLLRPGELPRLVSPLTVVEHDEGIVIDGAGERHVARVMAVKRP